MFFRTLAACFLAVTSLLTAAQEPPQLNVELIQEGVLENGSPVKYVKFSPSGSFKPGPGFLVCKHKNGALDINSVYIDADGTLKSEDGKDDVMFPMAGKLMENFEILLVAGTNQNDLQSLGGCSLVPFPAVVTDEAGHRIQMSEISTDNKHFVIVGSGYAPNETIRFTSRSGNEELSHDFKADSEGNFMFGESPAVIGMKGGTFTVTFTGADKNPLKLSHHWGEAP